MPEIQKYLKCCLTDKEAHTERTKGNLSGLILENHTWRQSPWD